MKITNATIYVCDRCGSEHRVAADTYPLVPQNWSVDSFNKKQLCEKCTVLHERLRQAFYNPKTFDILEMDYGMQILEKTDKNEYVERDTECDKCEYLFSCDDCIEVTRDMDTRRHYVRGLGNTCKLEVKNDN